MAKMNWLWLIVALAILGIGCAHRTKEESLSLSDSYLTNTFALRLSLRQEEGRERMSVAFQNISTVEQPIHYLTNLFEGKIILRDRAGELHEFLDREFLWLASRAFLNRPIWFLQPQENIVWELRSEDLVDYSRRRPTEPGQAPRGPTLSAVLGRCEECLDLQSAFETGCSIRAELQIDQWRRVGDGKKKWKFSGTIISGEITKE